MVAAPPGEHRPEPLSLCPSRRVGDSTQHELGLVLLSLWKLGEHVYDLVVPAALLCRLRIDVAQSSPDAQVSVSNHQPRAAQAPALDVPEHLGPALCGLPVSGNSAGPPPCSRRSGPPSPPGPPPSPSQDQPWHPPTCRPLPGHRGAGCAILIVPLILQPGHRARRYRCVLSQQPPQRRSRLRIDRAGTARGSTQTFLVLLTNSGSSRLSNCSSVWRTRGRAVPELSVSLVSVPIAGI